MYLRDTCCIIFFDEFSDISMNNFFYGGSKCENVSDVLYSDNEN